MKTQEGLYLAGVAIMREWCALNKCELPDLRRLKRNERDYNLGTCAYYRPTIINIMVEKCARPGTAGRCWSWPAYKIDRTPYGVIQHELAHHVDTLLSRPRAIGEFSGGIFGRAKEAPLTGYLGTGGQWSGITEWFAENFRLFVTNPDLSRAMRPRFYAEATKAGLVPLPLGPWEQVLESHEAPPRILEQARKQTGNQSLSLAFENGWEPVP